MCVRRPRRRGTQQKGGAALAALAGVGPWCSRAGGPAPELSYMHTPGAQIIHKSKHTVTLGKRQLLVSDRTILNNQPAQRERWPPGPAQGHGGVGAKYSASRSAGPEKTHAGARPAGRPLIRYKYYLAGSLPKHQAKAAGFQMSAATSSARNVGRVWRLIIICLRPNSAGGAPAGCLLADSQCTWGAASNNN